jgi:dTDP-4-amino-4,6-dideoxygalactose transaminase
VIEAQANASRVVPLVDVRAAHEEVAEEIQSGFSRVLASCEFIKGEDVGAFEQEYAEFAGVPHCVGVANGTDALEFSLRAAEVPAESTVLLPANTFIATAGAVVRAGARPLLADVDPETLLLDPACVEEAARPDTTAVIPVHLYGQIAPMEPIGAVAKLQGMAVIEDAAQAHGAAQDGRPAGWHGLAAAFSFYPGKNLGAYGDAGAVLTTSADLARRVRLLGDHGSERRYEHLSVGFNSRLDSLQAVVLRAKLRRLSTWNEARRRAAERYHQLLADVDEITLPRTAAGNTHVWHQYVIRVPHRDRVVASLNGSGIRAAIHYPVPVHLHPAFRHLGYCAGDFPVAESAASQIISLPLYPQITVAQQKLVAQELRKALTRGIGD